MQVVLTKLSDECHRFEVLRERGPHESLELETRSYLLHDLLHYALESAARRGDGFYARLASGEGIAALTQAAKAAAAPSASEPNDSPLARIERTVGVLTRFAKGEVGAEPTLTALEHTFRSSGATPPSWIDASLLHQVQLRLRQLTGHWRALGYGESLRLDWP
jgi:hypothetical protein